ncbi:hypothetical protein DUNSADRAFT_14925 [Dunaliella salina]|uniref:Encoded protein n=1 Tax=Dunaliella salina TaxID=3046 RepID=A0ABQ7G6G2_DUNSA|nr:hypothetical protein DUNSADRAFT_14925 [Dunaliella salina]|eukprot:KAF5830195.1 hypothetical protein DUNSADRAFT_14925 [Dunaliella salina]
MQQASMACMCQKQHSPVIRTRQPPQWHAASMACMRQKQHSPVVRRRHLPDDVLQASMACMCQKQHSPVIRRRHPPQGHAASKHGMHVPRAAFSCDMEEAPHSPALQLVGSMSQFL